MVLDVQKEGKFLLNFGIVSTLAWFLQGNIENAKCRENSKICATFLFPLIFGPEGNK